jgi:hypothetical protein
MLGDEHRSLDSCSWCTPLPMADRVFEPKHNSLVLSTPTWVYLGFLMPHRHILIFFVAEKKHRKKYY